MERNYFYILRVGHYTIVPARVPSTRCMWVVHYGVGSPAARLDSRDD